METCKNKIQRFFGFLPKLSVSVTGVVLAVIVILTIFFAPFISNAYIQPYVNMNWLFALIAFVAMLCLICLCVVIHKKRGLSFKWFIVIGTCVLFALQAFVMLGYFFIASWDVGRITFPHDIDNYYYSIYPNNLFIHGLIVRCTNFLQNTGFVEFLNNFASTYLPDSYRKITEIAATRPQFIPYAFNYVILVIVNICFVTSAIVMLANVAKKLLGGCVAKILFVFSAIFTGLMPWILVPYSDTFGLFFTVLILFAYVYIKNKPVKTTIITIATIIGFNIKPTVIFALFAILFVETCLLIKNYASKEGISQFKTKFLSWKNGILKPIFASAICILICGCLCFMFVGKIKNISTIEIDHNKEYTSTHFLMMGLDPVGRGFYTVDNISTSDSAATVEEREQKNLEKITDSIEQLGPLGIIQLFAEKLTITYADGTFMWHMDNGPNFMQYQIQKNPLIDTYYNNYGPFVQILWYVILLGAVAVLLFKNTRHNKYVAVLMSSILMLSLFLMLFECGARYLILYTPYFILTSAFGWKEISHKIKTKINERSMRRKNA